MTRQEKWLKLRIDLIQQHLQEWKNNVAQEVKARKLLIDDHKKQRDQLLNSSSAVEWGAIIVRYNKELINLSGRHEQQRKALKKRQEVERAELEL